jgi:hypothetical protein
MSELKTFWMRWQTNKKDPRPVIFPPKFLSWTSGYGDGYAIVCGLVKAEDEKAAWKLVKTHFPERQFRKDFCQEETHDFLPNNRFPIPDYWDMDNWTHKE